MIFRMARDAYNLGVAPPPLRGSVLEKDIGAALLAVRRHRVGSMPDPDEMSAHSSSTFQTGRPCGVV